MRKRDRIKGWFRRARGPENPHKTADAPSATMSSTQPPAPTRPEEAVEPEPEVEPEASGEEEAETEPDKTPEAEAEKENDVQAAKIAKHFEKTRRAMLKFLEDHDGTSHLKEMHDLSERRYFIAHRRFSDLMESLVDDGLIEFDHAKNEASLTVQGREYIAQ